MFIKLSIDATVDVNHTQQRARHESWKLIMAAKYLPARSKIFFRLGFRKGFILSWFSKSGFIFRVQNFTQDC